MTNCAYCERDILETPVRHYEKLYHLPCYLSEVHDDMQTIKMLAKRIISCTQDHNAEANTEARRIIPIVEKY